MSNLYPYLNKYKKHLVLGPIFKLLEAIFELIVPYVMAKLIDEGINTPTRLLSLKWEAY